LNVLAFETCFGACSAAVSVARGTGEARVESLFEARETGHAEALTHMIEATLARARLDMADVDRFAVTIGPGTFTGTRIGIAAARAFALATGKPVVAATSLAVMARQAADELDNSLNEDLLVAVDARRGALYAQLFAPDGWRARTAPLLLSPAGAGAAGAGPLLVVGSGAETVAAEARRSGRAVTTALPNLLPNARALLQLAFQLEPLSGPPAPLYLREPDAKPQDGYAMARA